MSLAVVWSQRAEEQLDEHVEGVRERRGVGAARALVVRVFERLDAVGQLPESAPRWRAVVDPAFRRLVVDDYVVIYRVAPEDRVIQVLSFRHGRQRPVSVDDVAEP